MATVGVLNLHLFLNAEHFAVTGTDSGGRNHFGRIIYELLKMVGRRWSTQSILPWRYLFAKIILVMMMEKIEKRLIRKDDSRPSFLGIGLGVLSF